LSKYLYEFGPGDVREISPRNAQLLMSGHIRYSGMQVLCGCCGGIGCVHCEPEPEPKLSRWQMLRRLFSR
jgi:hypothetical protein